MNVRMLGVMRLASTSRRNGDLRGASVDAEVSALGSSVAMGTATVGGGSGGGASRPPRISP